MKGAKRPCYLCGAESCSGDCKKCELRLKGECKSGRLVQYIDGGFRFLCYTCVGKRLKEKE